MENRAKIVFLDRDGTLNVDHGYISDPQLIELLPGVRDSLIQLRKAQFALVVVTNQSGIGRGLCSSADVEQCNQRLIELLGEQAAPDLILLCPHAPSDACSCRKPGVGMLHNEAFTRQFSNFDRNLSWMVGDKLVDVEFGVNAGLRPEHCLLLAGNPPPAHPLMPTVNELAAAIKLILH